MDRIPQNLSPFCVPQSELDDLVRKAAESLDLPNIHLARSTEEARVEMERFGKAAFTALVEGVGGSLELACQLMQRDGVLGILQALEEEEGVWDGRWDEFFRDPVREIARLVDHLRKRLESYTDGAGSGSLNDVLMEAAQETTGGGSM